MSGIIVITNGMRDRTYSNAAPMLLLVAVTAAVTISSRVYSGVPQENFVLSNDVAPNTISNRPTQIAFADLEVPNYSLRQPINVTLQLLDDEYVVCFPEAEIVTSGDTPVEAMKWMKDSIISTYELLRAKRVTLGPLPKRQLQALEKYVAKKQVRAA